MIIVWAISFIFHKRQMIVANLKTIYFSKQEIEKVIVKILTFRRSISLMQSCLALASIISKIFKVINTEDKKWNNKSILYFNKKSVTPAPICTFSIVTSTYTIPSPKKDQCFLYVAATKGLARVKTTLESVGNDKHHKKDTTLWMLLWLSKPSYLLTVNFTR